MKFTDSAAALLRRLEGCRLSAYRDQAGVWTIGYGHTGNVHAGDVWTQSKADAQLAADLRPRVEGVLHLVAGIPLNDNEFSALVIFAFNVGLIALAGSTALKLAKTGHMAQVPAALARWDFIHDASGVPVVDPGLQHRRAAEIALWNTPVVAQAAA